MNVACVRMPERGVYWVRCAPECAVAAGTRVVVQLDYGRDVGEVLACEEYRREKHGERPPGFRLERVLGAADAAAEAACAVRAAALGAVFERAMRGTEVDFRVIAARLALEGGRLFVRYACARVRPDLAPGFAALRDEGVSVQAWQAGARDAVAALGAMGPCGRVCCCASWQRRFPAGTGGERAAVGVCGKRRCCACFEEAP